MPKLSSELIRPIWERALGAEIGIAIETNDPTALRHTLLTAKKEFPDAETFDEIMTFCPKGLEEVWLVRKSAEIPDA
jgi:hypothetical protein